MITGAHLLLYSTDAEADRAFIHDVLGFAQVDAGQGWLIFKLPPAEVAVHPAGAPDTELWLMVDDVRAAVDELAGRGVAAKEPQDQGWGIVTQVTLPSGAPLGLYQPRHPRATELPG